MILIFFIIFNLKIMIIFYHSILSMIIIYHNYYQMRLYIIDDLSREYGSNHFYIIDKGEGREMNIIFNFF